jgi:peptidoglycan LD-endopeptidase CwlK
MNRYFVLAALVFFASFGYFSYTNPKPALFAFTDTKPVCDTTLMPDFSILELSLAIKPFLIADSPNQIKLKIIEKDGTETVFDYNKLTNNFDFTGNSLRLNTQTIADSIALKGMIVNNPRLYLRWANLLKPYRSQFLQKRNQLFDLLPSKLPNYDFKVISDFRLSDNQEQLLKTGKSAAPLSAHQFGLASDIAIKRKGKYLTGYTFYKIMGKIAIEQDLTWGGNFVGFVDPGHIQLYENSAKMLAIIPELRYEFEPFRQYYINRVEKMTKAGRAQAVEDTKELLEVMDVLNDEKICACEQKNILNQNFTGDNSTILKSLDNQKDKSILISINLFKNSGMINFANGKAKNITLGTWK